MITQTFLQEKSCKSGFLLHICLLITAALFRNHPVRIDSSLGRSRCVRPARAKVYVCSILLPLQGVATFACPQPRAPLRLPWAMELLGFQPAAHANIVQLAAHANIVLPASVHVLMKIRKKQQKHPTRFSALTGLQCNHATCLGKQAYHAAGIIALRRLHRQRTTSGKNSRFAQNRP